MKIAKTRASEINEPGLRLDGSYHASIGMEAIRFLKKWEKPSLVSASEEKTTKIREPQSAYGSNKLVRLEKLCMPGGIFIGGRAKRNYVTDTSYGIPFLSSSDMLQASFEGAKLISKKQPDLESMLLMKGWTLISRSGTIGNMAYVREDMEGLAASEHVMRIVPDTQRIPSGYLYTFLNSKIGQSVVKLGTFGTVVGTISTDYISSILIPRLTSKGEFKIHALVEEAANLRCLANREITQITADLVNELNLPAEFDTKYDHAFCVGQSSIDSRYLRLDAFYYIGHAGEALRLFDGARAYSVKSLGEVCLEVFNPPIFKRIYVDSNGIPYLMGAEVYELNPIPIRYLSKNTDDIGRYILEEGMVLIQDAGSRNGLIGTPIYVNRTLAGNSATNNMIRIKCSDTISAGYIYAFLSTEVGRRLIIRESYGSAQAHIFPKWLSEIPIPWPDKKLRNVMGTRVVEAFEKRSKASEIEEKAQTLLLHALGWERF